MNKLIYIIDDESAIRSMYKLALKNISSNFIIRDFHTSETALNNILKDNPDLIITDINRPGLNGLEFIRKVRNIAKGNVPKILIISGFLSSHLHEAEKLSDIYMIKPFEVDNFIKRVNYLLNNNISIKVPTLNILMNKLKRLVETIDSINYKTYSKFKIKDFIKPHETNTIDLFDQPESKREMVAFLQVLSSFFNRFNIDEFNLKIIPGKGSLNYLESFIIENNIDINMMYFYDLRDIIKLRNGYPTHLKSNYEIYDILKKWKIKDIKNVVLISNTARDKLLRFLKHFESKL